MSAKRNALGRGLNSLISIREVQTEGSSAINEIDVDDIMPNPNQPRSKFDEESLGELASSIQELGIVQPLSLRDMGDGRYQIIAGERRWRAAKLIGLKAVPAYVRSASDSEMSEMALIENIQREDLNAIEVALAFRNLIDTYNLTQEHLSKRVGKNRATIANHLRLLRLPAEVQLALRDKFLDMGHARALLSVDDPQKQLKLYKQIIKNDLSVRKVEELAKKINEENDADLNLEGEEKELRKKNREISEKISKAFSLPVKFSKDSSGKGSLTLKFKSEEELQSLLSIIDGIIKR